MKAIKAETEEQQLKVLELLEHKGYRWLGGRLPTEYIPCINSPNKENRYIRINESTKKLTTRPWLEPGDTEILYEQFVPKTKLIL